MAVTVRSKTGSTKRRLLFAGEPQSGKTYSLRTFGIEGQVHILAMPGEKGIQSIPEGENFHSYVFEVEPLPEDASLRDKLQVSLEKKDLVERTTRSILAGKEGKVDVFVADGLLKYHEIITDCVSGGRFLEGKPFETKGDYTTKLFGPAHQLFKNYLSEIYYSQVPIFIGTTWVKYDFESENESQQQKESDLRHGMRKLYPHLPGQMRHDITGEFDGYIHCCWVEPTQCDMCKFFIKKGQTAHVIEEPHRVWQVKPKGEVVGVGLKDHTGRLSSGSFTYIHQDWQILKQLIEGK